MNINEITLRNIRFKGNNYKEKINKSYWIIWKYLEIKNVGK